ncbi:MAG: hypothetical protein P8J91_05430 [Pirellulaceae bacterium]|nr:hypothetical protein [Planctomycetaceae bacterium]MDG2103172.1 hypothetical protein [Pirellulaceae bacterium]
MNHAHFDDSQQEYQQQQKSKAGPNDHRASKADTPQTHCFGGVLANRRAFI